MAGQKIILKADDLRYHSPDTLSPKWAAFIQYVIEEDLKAGLGLIGRSLEEGDQKYLDLLRDLHQSRFFELWNHGYTHLVRGRDSNGEIYHEFQRTSYNDQRTHLLKTQRLAQEKLGVKLRTFGAPANQIDKVTRRVIDEIDDVQVWLFGDPASPKCLYVCRMDVEYGRFNLNYHRFRRHYDPTPDCLILQIHPHTWDRDRFQQFFQVVQFLKRQGCVFTTPLTYNRCLRASGKWIHT